jgi:hypothetical protein
MRESSQLTAQLSPVGGRRPRAGLHRHQWELVDQIGCVCTYQCPCGKSKTRIRDAGAQPLPDQPAA